MSGETLEDYFRHLNLDEARRKFLESMKEGKQDKVIEEHYFKNAIREEYSAFVPDRYSLYMKRFVVTESGAPR